MKGLSQRVRAHTNKSLGPIGTAVVCIDKTWRMFMRAANFVNQVAAAIKRKTAA